MIKGIRKAIKWLWDGSDFGRLIVVVGAVGIGFLILSIVIGGIIEGLVWIARNPAFSFMIIAFIASLIITGEVFAFLRRKAKQTDIEQALRELNTLREDLEELQRRPSGYLGLTGYAKTAGERLKTPKRNERG